MSIIYLLWGVHILLNMIMGGLKHINIVRAFASKICFKLNEVSLEITNLFMEDIIHIGVMRELMVMVMMVILMMMRILEMKMRGDGSNERGVCDERAGSNERGVCDEDQDGVPSNHGSTSSPYNYDRSVKRKSFDTPIDPITRKKRASSVWNNRVSSNL
jgi:hypothetical protein